MPQAVDCHVRAIFRSTRVFIPRGGVAVGQTSRADSSGSARVCDPGCSGAYAAPLASVVDTALSVNAALAGRLRPLHAAGGNDRTSDQPDRTLCWLRGRFHAPNPDVSYPPDGPAMITLRKGRATPAEDADSQTL